MIHIETYQCSVSPPVLSPASVSDLVARSGGHLASSVLMDRPSAMSCRVSCEEVVSTRRGIPAQKDDPFHSTTWLFRIHLAGNASQRRRSTRPTAGPVSIPRAGLVS